MPARGVAGVLRVAGDVPPYVGECSAAAGGRPLGRRDVPGSPGGPSRRGRSASRRPPAGAHRGPPGDTALTVRYRLRETGMYDGAPFVEEWKPLPPRLHADVSEQHTVEIGRVAVAAVEVPGDDGAALTGLTLDEARAHAASLGARLPTEFEWQLAAADPAFRRAEPLVWNWTESEHSDGITRFAILKGGMCVRRRGSEWYFDGGPRPPEFSAKLLLAGLGIERSPSIGFRLAWDLDQGGGRMAEPTGPLARGAGHRRLDAVRRAAGGDVPRRPRRRRRQDRAPGRARRGPHSRPGARRRRPVVEDARAQQADGDARPVADPKGPPCCCASPSAPTC